jgi:hypothetical protein
LRLAIGSSKIVSNEKDRHSGGSGPTRRDVIFPVARDLPGLRRGVAAVM